MSPFRRRRARSTGGNRGVKRNREWITWTSSLASGYAVPNLIELAPGDRFNSWIITPEEAKDEWDEPTIVRSLLRFFVGVAGGPTVTSATYDLTVRGGLIVWKGNVNGPPAATALDDLDPQDGSLDWLWWDEAHLEHVGIDTFGFNQLASSGTPQGGRIDVRSKRKMELGFGLVGAFENVAAASANARMMFSGRALLLNH